MTQDYLQGFRWKETINLAPDCLVWVQQDSTAPVCPVCGGKKDFQSDINDVSISLSTEGAPGSASFTINVPRHGMTKYDIGGELVFKPMQEVEIWMKGRYLVNEEPRYYPVFWGMITNVGLTTGPEMWSINIQCADILHWWTLTSLTTNPAALEAMMSGSTAFPVKHVFANFNPYEIILALSLIGFGDILAIKNIGIGDQPQFVQQINEDIQRRRDEIIRYWQRRFQQVAARLKIFGINGYRLNRDVDDINIEKFAEEFWDQARVGAGGRSPRQTLPGLTYDLDTFSRFRFDEFIGANDSLTESEQQTKMELAQNAAGSIGFEFYMDTNGDIIFKPPFYNMDVREAGPVYTITEQDIVSLDFQIDSSQIYTRADITGRFMQGAQTETGLIYGTFVDYDLTRHYGMRNLELHAPFLRTARSCYMYGVAKLAEQNARAWSANLTIMGRPELRLGRPVYIESHDLFGYVSSITHSFNFGGTFSTTLTLTALRPKYHRTDPFDQLDRDDAGGRQSFSVLGSGKVEGDPNRVMVFRSEVIQGDTDSLRAVDTDDRGFSAVSGQETAATRSQFNEAQNAPFSQYELDALREDQALRQSYGTKQGFWIEASIPGVYTATERFIPISDGSGYRHIGGFPYGRGMTIGSLDAIKPTVEGGTVVVEEVQRTPTVIEQYGLSSGRSFNPRFTRIQVALQSSGEALPDLDADATNADELASLKNQAGTFRDIASAQAQSNPAGGCSCTGDTYAGALVDKIIRENRGVGAVDRAAELADANARSVAEPASIQGSRFPTPPFISPIVGPFIDLPGGE